MRFLKRVLTTLVILIVVLLAIVLVGRNVIVRYGAPLGARMFAGVRLDIKNVDIGLLDSHAGITGVEIMNPPNFRDETMIEIPELFVDYDVGSFFRDEIHLEEVRFDLSRLLVVRNKNGDFNFWQITKTRKRPGKPEEPAKPKKDEKKKRKRKFRIDVVKFKLGTVVFEDYSAGAAPKVRTFDLNLDEQYENVGSPGDVMNIILAKAIVNTSIGALADIDVDALKENAAAALAGAAGQLGDQLTDALEARGVILTNNEVGKALENAAEELKKLF